MKNKKIIIILIAAIVFCAAVIGVVRTVKEYKDALSKQIEDQNGDDKSLCVITDDMIEAADHTYISIKHTVYSEGLKDSGVQEEMEEFDNAYSKIKSNMLSGVYLCNVYAGQDATVTYIIESEIKSGNCRIVITDSQGKIFREIPIDQKAEVSFMAPKDEIFMVKCAGESAAFDIEIKRSDDRQ